MDETRQRLMAELAQFGMCQLLDAVGSTSAVETGILPVATGFRICGPAFTVECYDDDNLTLHHALHLGETGDVLVVACSRAGATVRWGELMSLCAQSKRLGGTIIDRSVRDPVEIQTMGYPVFCQHFHPQKP